MPQKAQYDPGNLPVITVIGHTVVTIFRSGSGPFNREGNARLDDRLTLSIHFKKQHTNAASDEHAEAIRLHSHVPTVDSVAQRCHSLNKHFAE
jgi:hypothetical protein